MLFRSVIKAISEAREHDGLSENAEYHAARERQSFIEGRISELEDIISRADVIDPSKLGGKIVRFGAYVTLADVETDKAVMELTARADGILRRILKAEGDTAPIGVRNILAEIGWRGRGVDVLMFVLALTLAMWGLRAVWAVVS